MNSEIDNQATLLIVDDDSTSLSLLNDFLSNQGYSILIAMDGAQALSILERITPDLVMMDALMPKMNGFEVTKAIKAQSGLVDIPVVFITGLGETENVVKGLASGGIDYIQKPFNLDEVAARIEVHLKNSRLARSRKLALNEIGQLTFSAARDGMIVWQTQQAKTILGEYSQEQAWLAQGFNKQLARWFESELRKGDEYTLHTQGALFRLKYLGRSSPKEYLLKIMTDDDEQGIKKLKKSYKLTQRESEVLIRLAKGKSNQEIAQILGMSPRTVNKHLESVYRKLEVDNRTSAAGLCIQLLAD